MPNPFGVAAGSTPSQSDAAYFITFRSVPNPHPDLKEYRGFWHPKHGLVKIYGVSEIFIDPSGFRALRLYERIKRQLISVYGTCATVEMIEPASVWSADNEFIASISRGDRYHGSVWDASTKAKLDSSITEICLSVHADDDERCTIHLDYAFVGFNNEPDDEVGIGSL